MVQKNKYTHEGVQACVDMEAHLLLDKGHFLETCYCVANSLNVISKISKEERTWKFEKLPFIQSWTQRSISQPTESIENI
jgi:hypothetical protein